MNKINLLIFRGCRSDYGLTNPIITRLKKEEWCSIKCVDLEPQNFITSYQIAEYYCKAEKHISNHNAQKPDICVIVGDRVEMCAAAAAAFHNNVKIAHVYGGVINYPKTTYDDTDRDVISLWADIHFVESLQCGYNVAEITRTYIADYPINPLRELASAGIHVCGCTHLDDLEIDESLVPYDQVVNQPYKTRPYDLFLYNKPTITMWGDERNQIRQMIMDSSFAIVIGSNPDGDPEITGNMIDRYYHNLPRAQFLGLLKNCSRFISNSSATVYEAPFFLKPEQIISVGDRNKNRPKVECKPGGSDKIVQVLKEILCK